MSETAAMQNIEKALKVNLDPGIYGTIAEIGAGQEVARNFFQAGAAAGTIAKTMSAYDMQVSDAIYGQEESKRYVTRSRVEKMIDREYNLVLERLAKNKPDTRFFAFSDTVAAKAFRGKKDCHGWVGIQFQHEVNALPSQIVLHVRMLDNTNQMQQKALGVIGVNLIHGAFYLSDKPERLIEGLLDNVSNKRLEVDMINFSGAAFPEVDNRIMALHLVKKKLSRSVMFNTDGEAVHPADLLYKKSIMLLRGTFRPVHNIHMDMLNSGIKEIQKDEAFQDEQTLLLTEISMSKLINKGGVIDSKDFLGRVDTLCKLGYNVQISNYTRLFRLKEYLANFTQKQIAIMLGVRKVYDVFASEYYNDLCGGIYEAVGILFSGNTRLYVYPKLDGYNEILTIDNLRVEDKMKYLYVHFKENGRILPITEFNRCILDLNAKTVADDLLIGDDDKWKHKVPLEVFELIKERELFGYKSACRLPE